MALNAAQRRLLREITAAGGTVIDDPRIRRIADRAAAQTGLVESNLRNLNYGDADSEGWRQERKSLYPNPTNVKASAKRFYKEFLEHYDPGEKSYEVAAQVQRPAAQYRGRYKDVAKQAASALKSIGDSSGSGRRGSQQPSGRATEQTTTTVTGAGFDPGPGASALAQLAQQQARPQAPTSMPSPPQFSARAAMPTGYQAPSAAPIEQPQSNLTELLANVSSGGGSIPQVDVQTRTSKTAGQSQAKGEGGGGKSSRKDAGGPIGGPLLEMFYNGPGGVNVDNGKRVKRGFVSGHTNHVHVAAGPKTTRTLAKLAQDMGLTVRELEPYDKVDPVHTGGSYHYRKQAADISGDPKLMAEYSRRVARLFGVKV